MAGGGRRPLNETADPAGEKEVSRLEGLGSEADQGWEEGSVGGAQRVRPPTLVRFSTQAHNMPPAPMVWHRTRAFVPSGGSTVKYAVHPSLPWMLEPSCCSDAKPHQGKHSWSVRRWIAGAALFVGVITSVLALSWPAFTSTSKATAWARIANKALRTKSDAASR